MSQSIEDDTTCKLLPSGGYDDDIFVDPPADSLGVHCPVCQLVLREPHLLSCCGAHLCEVCVKKIKDSDNLCPSCNEENFHTLLNKEKKKVVCGLKVYCSNKATGCTWTGELGDANKHLETGCDYVEEDCPNGCGQRLPHHLLQVHTTYNCKCTERPIEVQLQCLSQEMMDKLTALETKYEEKVMKLQEKVKEQEKKLIKQEEELVKQEQTFRKEMKEMNDKLSRCLEEVERERLTDKVDLKKQLKLLEDASVSCKEDAKKVNAQIKKLKACVQFEAFLPVSKGPLKYMKTHSQSSYTSNDRYNNSTRRHVKVEVLDDAFKLEHGFNSEHLVAEERSRLSSIVSAIGKRVVSFPPEKRNVFQYLFKSKPGQSVIEQLESSRHITIYVEDGLVTDQTDDAVEVTVFGPQSDEYNKCIDEVGSKLEGYIENSVIVRKFQGNMPADSRGVQYFAKSKSVEVSWDSQDMPRSGYSYQQQQEALSDTISLVGGQFEVQLVVDYMKEKGILQLENELFY